MKTFFFYDLETSGFHPRNDRIMQFAGQRTTLSLEPIREPYDFLIQLTSDILPDPDAILVTGITPQRTKEEGYTENEFAKVLLEEIATSDTIFVGFNTIRFDDEFMRSLLYRNLYDPYEWQWREGNSRWDLLDVVRMTRALRPDGIKWPTLPSGAKANKLELITAANRIDHTHAHNAMSDVSASIEVARLLKDKQPKLFEYLLDMREKTKVKAFVESSAMFVYTSGSFSQDFEKTTVVCPVMVNDPAKALVYDLRVDPDVWLKDDSSDRQKVPFKYIKYNHCPAIAPLGVLDDTSWATIGLSKETIAQNKERMQVRLEALLAKFHTEFPESSFEKPDPSLMSVDALLYDGFFSAKDKKTMDRIHSMELDELIEFQPEFEDPRGELLFFLYKGRQFPKSLLAEDREAYEAYVVEKLHGGGEQSALARYMARLNELAKLEYLDADKRYILDELALYAESILP